MSNEKFPGSLIMESVRYLVIFQYLYCVHTMPVHVEKEHRAQIFKKTGVKFFFIFL